MRRLVCPDGFPDYHHRRLVRPSLQSRGPSRRSSTLAAGPHNRRGSLVRRVDFRVFPPGPRGRVLLGSLPDIRRDPLAFLSRVSAEYGDIAHFRLGPLHAVLLNHPDDIERVLVTDQHRFIKGRTLNGARRLFGNGLLTSDGALHGRQRRLVQPAFYRPRLNEYAGIMTTAAIARCATRGAMETLSTSRRNEPATLAISGQILFGADGEAVAAEIAMRSRTVGSSRDCRTAFAALVEPFR